MSVKHQRVPLVSAFNISAIHFQLHVVLLLFFKTKQETVVQEVKKSFSNQKVASSIPCRSVLEQDTEPLIAPDVQCATSVKKKYVKCVCKSLWIKASAKCKM